MKAADFRKEIEKIMPGYNWTLHKSRNPNYLSATGTQSSGFNRLSTLQIVRREQNDFDRYEAKSAGYGKRALWLHTANGKTLARALRNLQSHYEATAATYMTHAAALETGRVVPNVKLRGRAL
jgi:hypothetical protein